MSLNDFQSDILPIKNKLFRFALRFVEHAAEAEDVVQEVFIKLWNNREQLAHVGNLEAWCITATKNLSIDKLRSKHQRLEPLRAGFDWHDASPSPYEQAVESDTFDQVKKMLHELPDKQRDIMQLRDIEGMSYQEIADALGLPLEQVKVYLFRARKAMRERLVGVGMRS